MQLFFDLLFLVWIFNAGSRWAVRRALTINGVETDDEEVRRNVMLHFTILMSLLVAANYALLLGFISSLT